MPSSREGFEIVVIEANACGITVITINNKDNTSKNLIEEGKKMILSGKSMKKKLQRNHKNFEKSLARKMKKSV